MAKNNGQRKQDYPRTNFNNKILFKYNLKNKK